MTQVPPPAEEPARTTPAGWYPHPTMAGTQAYWDGERWTDHVAPTAPQGGATDAAAKVFLLLVALVAVGAVVVLAGLLVG